MTKRSNLPAFAAYGNRASHSRWFRGLRLRLVCTPSGLPVSFDVASRRADEREVLRDLLKIEPQLLDTVLARWSSLTRATRAKSSTTSWKATALPLSARR